MQPYNCETGAKMTIVRNKVAIMKISCSC